MIFYWGYFLIGLLLALLPGKLLRGRNCRNFQYDQLSRTRSDKSRRRRRWWKLPAVWIEPARGYAATWLLLEGVDPLPDAVKLQRLMPTLLVYAILTIGVCLQTFGKREKHQLVAPVGYLGGLLLALLPLAVSIPCLVLGAASSVAFRRWEAGFLIGSLCCLILGYFFIGPGLTLLWASAIYAWPVVLTWFTQSQLVLPVRI